MTKRLFKVQYVWRQRDATHEYDSPAICVSAANMRDAIARSITVAGRVKNKQAIFVRIKSIEDQGVIR